ncbi:fatty acid desaturase-domain-containing protein [Catenaria anguillulae PL171]|uniref:Fatty acid desaturase-domain-containing protein n=1 Tax=Catenaria anguillulae PL171 TaxID=765915 RepID=A0A1Y2HCV9_9FUNG|nr:fatty acid desaturase-domain-containing protein [Catenaria anguillulae PL171]
MVSTTARADSGTASPLGLPTFTRADLALHAQKFPWSPDSTHPTYMVIHNKVYDIRDLIPAHPGGAVILTHVGRDGSDAFDAFHPESTAEVLADYYVGDLVDKDKVRVEDRFAEQIRGLKREFAEEGLYKSNKLYFSSSFRFLSPLRLWPLPSFHDFLHHAVFRNRDINNLIGYLVGGVFQGFSVSWWKDKHNTHHAQPNVHGEDPDIDTMPLLAWSEHALELFADVTPGEMAASPGLAKLFVPRQAVLYFPILAVARVSWALQSALHSGTRTSSVALHWVWYFGLLTTCLTPLRALAYFAASQAACGLLLASVFSLNHNGMRILSQAEADKMDFYTKQIVTGRDVHPSLVHHLFPNMPRHAYPKVKPVIERLCREAGVDHHSTGFWEGTAEVLRRLDEISRIAVGMDKAKQKAE